MKGAVFALEFTEDCEVGSIKRTGECLTTYIDSIPGFSINSHGIGYLPIDDETIDMNPIHYRCNGGGSSTECKGVILRFQYNRRRAAIEITAKEDNPILRETVGNVAKLLDEMKSFKHSKPCRFDGFSYLRLDLE